MNKKITGNEMKLSHFHDFYFLEAMKAGIMMANVANPDNNFRRAFEKLEADIETAFSHLTKTMALRIYVYLWAASLGEARHANDCCADYHIRELDGMSRKGVYKMAIDYLPTPENVQSVKTLYESEWSSGFGGEAWLSIVEGMEMYGNVPDATFIDHAVDLEHNGGNVFNKDARDTVNLQCYGYDADDLRVFLNHKFSSDILNKKIQYFEIAVSRKVFSLLHRYNNVVKPIKAVKFVEPKLEWLSDYSVTWGNETLELEKNDITETWDECAWCINKIHPERHFHYHDTCICRSCYENKVTTCQNCHEDITSNDTTEIWSGNHYENWCPDCVSNYSIPCEKCADDVDEEHNTKKTEDGYTVCNNCAEEMYCEECDEYYYHIETHNEEEHPEPIELPIDSDGIFSPVALEEK